MNIPTPGRVVLFIHSRNAGPLPALVVAALGDGLVDLTVFQDRDGQSVGPVMFARDVAHADTVAQPEEGSDEHFVGWCWPEEMFPRDGGEAKVEHVSKAPAGPSPIEQLKQRLDDLEARPIALPTSEELRAELDGYKLDIAQLREDVDDLLTAPDAPDETEQADPA